MIELKYVLAQDGRTPIAEPDILKWAQWFEQREKRIVRQDYYGKVLISTVFLGIDHSWRLQGLPILWETMIFDCKRLEDYQQRYSSYEEALRGHQRALDEYLKILFNLKAFLRQ